MLLLLLVVVVLLLLPFTPLEPYQPLYAEHHCTRS
jgi:hypothetical protein